MIERLQRALRHIEDVPPGAQEEIAAQIEEMAHQDERLRETNRFPAEQGAEESLPKSVRDALAVIGAWRDLQDDDEFAALNRIRHESQPTPPIDLDGI